MLLYMSPRDKMRYMTKMACKIVVNAKELCKENLGDNADKIEEDLEFLKKVIEQVHSTCQVIVARRRGEVIEEPMDNSWDKISDKVESIVESSIENDDNPGPRKWPQNDNRSKKNTISHLPNGKNGDKCIRKQKGKQTQKDKGGGTCKKADDKASNGGGGSTLKASDQASQESDTSVDSETQVEQESEVKVDKLLCQVKIIDNKVLTVTSLWKSINRDALRDHRLEENDSYWWLITGYGTPTVEEFILQKGHFGDFAGSLTSFQEQVNCDMRIDKCLIDGRIESRDKLIYKMNSTHRAQNLIHNILSTMVQIKQAIDWKEKELEWKTAYTNWRFNDECRAKIANMKALKSPTDYQEWLEVERKRFKDLQGKAITMRNWAMRLYAKFGSIVLLDPRWNPEVYGKSNHSDTFAKFLNYMDDHPIMREAIGNEVAKYDGNIEEIDGKTFIDHHAGNEGENNRMVLRIVRFITKDEDVVGHIKEFIKKKVEW
ncbi:hypothetical protein BDN71DRAFT_1435595 [Pleurotus eryngii]|uniref:Uncharacterized protein n=1 Tax=Pleurotus eryngii TaxID=5323 RepID=A0A9P6DAY2_PLEER|nr:hypothetical protein BDN71DRAFT_1435595 [Pleurotus eryngii]